MNKWHHPTNVAPDVYDPLNHEYWLVDQTDSDHIKQNSPYILYWKYDAKSTIRNNDELSILYGESNELVFHSLTPTRVYMYPDIAPIIQELNRMGGNQIQDVTYFANQTDFIEKIGRPPLSGDLFCTYFFQKDKIQKKVFYTVSSFSEFDLHMYRYIHFILNVEQSNLSNVPKEIFDFKDFDL
jgi:hypothetical protein